MSLRRAQLITTALRSFFRFLYERGEIPTDLAASVLTVANWRLSDLPKFLEPEHVECLLGSCNRSAPTGRRDYAVLLLLARLGLRAGEVVHMTLDDIDWENGEITVRGKSLRHDRLPIPKDVGEALAGYLCHRPRCSSRKVFLRIKAPRQGFVASSAIGDIVRRALVRAGLHPARKGCHLLRHTLAIKMLRGGASLAEIGEILRNELPRTTEIYTKVDVAALRALALPLKGGRAMKLRDALEEYLNVCRALGFKLQNSGGLLKRFVSYVEREGVSSITTEVALRWAMEQKKCQPAQWANRLSTVRIFARYMKALDPRTEVPPQGLLPYRFRRTQPYLYTDEEIARLIQAAQKLPSPLGLRAATYSTLFGLLAVTGMRMRESIALDRDNVDLTRGILTVRGAKFGKSRIVSVHASTRETLRRYYGLRDRICPRAKSFFASEGGARLTVWIVRWTFVRLSRQIGLRGQAESHGPRLHDLRHRFAVQTLLGWYRAGLNVEQHLHGKISL